MPKDLDELRGIRKITTVFGVIVRALPALSAAFIIFQTGVSNAPCGATLGLIGGYIAAAIVLLALATHFCNYFDFSDRQENGFAPTRPRLIRSLLTIFCVAVIANGVASGVVGANVYSSRAFYEFWSLKEPEFFGGIRGVIPWLGLHFLVTVLMTIFISSSLVSVRWGAQSRLLGRDVLSASMLCGLLANAFYTPMATLSWAIRISGGASTCSTLNSSIVVVLASGVMVAMMAIVVTSAVNFGFASSKTDGWIRSAATVGEYVAFCLGAAAVTAYGVNVVSYLPETEKSVGMIFSIVGFYLSAFFLTFQLLFLSWLASRRFLNSVRTPAPQHLEQPQ